jgi:hypothetical protein
MRICAKKYKKRKELAMFLSDFVSVNQNEDISGQSIPSLLTEITKQSQTIS